MLLRNICELIVESFNEKKNNCKPSLLVAHSSVFVAGL